MKNANGTLLALFASDQPFQQFDLYTFTLSSGLVLRYSNCAFDVIAFGNTYLQAKSAGGVIIDEQGDSGPRATWTDDLTVGTWSVTVLPRPVDKIGDLNWLQAVRAGILQEAMVSVDRAYIAAWPSNPVLTIVPIGTVNVFYGRVAEIDFGRSAVGISMNDPRELLSVQTPRQLFQGGCRFALFDQGCTLDKTVFRVGSIVTSVAATNILTTNLTAYADGYFSLGSIEFTTGKNTGLHFMVRESDQAGGALVLINPIPFLVNVGDLFWTYPGCDKTQATCINKFNNKINYGGFDYVPVPEAAV